MATDFTEKSALDYDQRILRLVPRYKLAQSLIAATLADLLPDGALFLVAGCGTGGDLITLGETNLSWQFSAVEPSSAMLAVAEQKARSTMMAGRIAFHNSTLQDAALTFHGAAVW